MSPTKIFHVIVLLLFLVLDFQMAVAVDIPTLLKRNEQYAEFEHLPIPNLREFTGQAPALSVVIVSCVDARVEPEKFFKIPTGEAFIFKTIAGHPQASLQDIVVIDTLSSLKHLVILHHTDCGASYATNEGLKAKLLNRLPSHKREIEDMKFGAISNAEEAVKADVAWIRSHPYIRKELADNTVGMIYDLKTGLVKLIEGPVDNHSSKSEL